MGMHVSVVIVCSSVRVIVGWFVHASVIISQERKKKKGVSQRARQRRHIIIIIITEDKCSQ